MDNSKFEKEIQNQIKRCETLLISKGKEYKVNTSYDRLEHFKKAAALMGCTPRGALLGMMSKHLVSVSKMCASWDDYPLDLWDEKITDSINYLLILSAMVRENISDKEGKPVSAESVEALADLAFEKEENHEKYRGDNA